MPGNNSSSIPQITLEDLKDPKQYRLNSLFSFVFEMVSNTQGGNGPFAFISPVSAPAFKATQATPPTDPNELITRGNADKLYSPQVQRNASRLGKWERLPVLPIGSGGSSSTSGTTSISAAIYLSTNALSGNITFSYTVAPAASLLIAEFTQDATGGRTVTWSSDFEDVGFFIFPNANSRTVCFFYSNGSKWRPILSTTKI